MHKNDMGKSLFLYLGTTALVLDNLSPTPKGANELPLNPQDGD